jgi:hypothetical protein
MCGPSVERMFHREGKMPVPRYSHPGIDECSGNSSLQVPTLAQRLVTHNRLGAPDFQGPGVALPKRLSCIQGCYVLSLLACRKLSSHDDNLRGRLRTLVWATGRTQKSRRELLFGLNLCPIVRRYGASLHLFLVNPFRERVLCLLDHPTRKSLPRPEDKWLAEDRNFISATLRGRRER